MAAMSRPHTANLVAALVGCIFAMLFNFARADDCGGFAGSCDSIAVSTGGVLTANCANDAGKRQRTGIDLNPFIGNDNGNLVDGSGFANSCQNIRWYKLNDNNQGIEAECFLVDGKLGDTTLYNVQRRVENVNGNLVWNICSPLETVVDNSTNVAARKMLLE